jgi:hypothetical protein
VLFNPGHDGRDPQSRDGQTLLRSLIFAFPFIFLLDFLLNYEAHDPGD